MFKKEGRQVYLI